MKNGGKSKIDGIWNEEAILRRRSVGMCDGSAVRGESVHRRAAQAAGRRRLASSGTRSRPALPAPPLVSTPAPRSASPKRCWTLESTLSKAGSAAEWTFPLILVDGPSLIPVESRALAL